MFDFFDKIIGFFEMIWTLVVNLVNSLLMLLGTIVNIPVVIGVLSMYLPAVIFTGVMVTISFAVIKLIVGR